MAKFMILYNTTASPKEIMANASPEEMKASMQEWIRWREEASKTTKVEFGMPVQAVNRITHEGVTDSDSKTSGYSLVEGESKEAILEVLKSHPHLKRDDTWIDLFEVLPMPGL